VDKLGHDWRGDPSSALLEVLDPEQNHTFMDHYLDVPFDLSKVMFIATANQADSIPRPLLDRMELIEIPGYTQHEKSHIARGHLIPRQIERHGLTDDQVEISDEILSAVIGGYTREAGVRTLERRIGGICRGIAVKVVEGTFEEKKVAHEDLSAYLGPERYEDEKAERFQVSGVATGMAWTSAGGDILFVEAADIPGTGKLKLTGHLGDVMKESAELALSLVKTDADIYGLDIQRLLERDLHIHVPSGAIPKDGPSAGITMYTALFSVLSGSKVRGDRAMTGEISLRGAVLPVGGIKEKVLAALRSGVKEVILPEKNRKDLQDIPEDARKQLKFHFISRVGEVLPLALHKKPKRRKRGRYETTTPAGPVN
jgi:ATP-dependent Lon protease